MFFRLVTSLALFLLLVSTHVLPQVAASGAVTSTVTTPSDPVALLSIAHEKNGLNSSDVRPWHIRGTYKTYDLKGIPDDSGVYEEWWASSAKYKRSYAGTKFKQIEYATGTDLYREGSQDWLSGSELLFRASLIYPLPDNELLKEFTPQSNYVSDGQTKLNCVRYVYQLPASRVPASFFRTVCFSTSIPALRVDSQGTIQTTFNQIVTFQGHYLARELHCSMNGKPRFDLKLEVIEGLKNPPDDLFTPSLSATQVDIRTAPIKLSKGSSQLIPLKQTILMFPESVRESSIQGSVLVRIVVGKNGHVISQMIRSGTPQLRQSVLDASREWTYLPFRVMGKPTEVEADITINLGTTP